MKIILLIIKTYMYANDLLATLDLFLDLGKGHGRVFNGYLIRVALGISSPIPSGIRRACAHRKELCPSNLVGSIRRISSRATCTKYTDSLLDP